MLNLTAEERKVVLFLLCAAFAGAGIKFALKLYPASAQAVQVDAEAGKADLNKAGMAELLRAKVLPPALAEKLIAYRREHGPFSRLEEVKEIKGIGQRRYEKIAEYFRLE